MRVRPARTALAIGALAALLALPAGALGATAATDRACYSADGSDAVPVTGTGFAPGSPVNVLVDNGIVTTVTAGPDGSVAAKLPVPRPPAGGPTAHDRAYVLRLEQPADAAAGVPGAVASASFHAVDILGDYTPDAKNLLAKVRFMAFGLTARMAQPPAQATAYLHYVDPRGKAKLTVALGKAELPCGSIRRTKRMRIFPFTPRSGKWTLQFDTSKAYAKSAPGAVRLRLTI